MAGFFLFLDPVRHFVAPGCLKDTRRVYFSISCFILYMETSALCSMSSISL